MYKNVRINERLLAQNPLLTAMLAIGVLQHANCRSNAKRRRRNVGKSRAVLLVWST